MSDDDFQAGLGQRISEALKHAGISQSDLARRLGVDKVTVSRWVHGQQQPRLAQVAQIVEMCGVLADWLVMGRGGMLDSTLERDDDPEVRHPSLRAFRERFGGEYSAKTIARLRKFAAADGEFPTTAEGWKWIAETLERGAP